MKTFELDQIDCDESKNIVTLQGPRQHGPFGCYFEDQAIQHQQFLPILLIFDIALCQRKVYCSYNTYKTNYFRNKKSHGKKLKRFSTFLKFFKGFWQSWHDIFLSWSLSFLKLVSSFFKLVSFLHTCMSKYLIKN